MRGAIPPLPNTPSRRGVLLEKSTGTTLPLPLPLPYPLRNILFFTLYVQFMLFIQVISETVTKERA
jgi:hypothetical protein